MVTKQFLISGIVQGVGFRNFTQRQGRALGLVGRVANLPDGRVEVFVQGQPQVVNEFAKILSRGPDRANVEEVVAVELEDSEGRFEECEGDFLIDR